METSFENQKIIPLKESYFGIIDKTHWNEIRLRVSAWDESALTFWTLFILWLIVIKAKAYGTMGPSENRRFKAYHDRIYSEAPFTTFLQILGNLFTLFYSLFANQRLNKILGRFTYFGGSFGFALNIHTHFHFSLCQ